MTLTELATALLREFVASERPFFRLTTTEFTLYAGYDKESGAAFVSIKETADS